MSSRGRTTTPARLGVTDEFLRELWVAHFGVNCTFDRVVKLLEEVFEMSVFERRQEESLTDWALRWMSSAPHLQKRAAQEVQAELESPCAGCGHSPQTCVCDEDARYQRDQQDRANNLMVSDPPSKEELE